MTTDTLGDGGFGAESAAGVHDAAATDAMADAAAEAAEIEGDAEAGTDAPSNEGGDSWVATSLAVGGHHACALTTQGGVLCWGDNRSGQLGDGTMKQRNAPVFVSGLTSG